MSNNIKLVKPNRKKTVQVTSPEALQGIDYSGDSDSTVDLERQNRNKRKKKIRRKKNKERQSSKNYKK